MPPHRAEPYLDLKLQLRPILAWGGSAYVSSPSGRLASFLERFDRPVSCRGGKRQPSGGDSLPDGRHTVNNERKGKT